MECHFRDQDCDSPLAVILSLALLTCSLWWKSDATLWGAPWRGPCGKELRTDSLQPIASKEPRPWVQQPTRNWLPIITWVGLESSPSPAEPWVWLTSWLQPHERTWGPKYAMLCYAKSLQSCPTRWDPIEGSPPGSPVPGVLQARTLEWAAISFSNAWKWKVKVKSLSRVRLLATPWTAA